MVVDLYTRDGQVKGQVELPDEVFNIEPHEYAMYMAVRAYLSNRRQGTHKVKTRAEVSGGGRKPWPQKGRGVARAGSIRSPLWIGGGKVHGPRPRDYSMHLPRKLKRLARKSALSARAREHNLIVVEDFDFERPKTKQMVAVLDALGLSEVKTLQLDFERPKTKQMVAVLDALGLSEVKTLQLLPEPKPNVMLSGRNLPKLTTMPAFMVSAYDILSHHKVLLHQGAIQVLVEQLAEGQLA